MQKRVLLYCHDGSGLGHLRRLSRIAAALQGSCATLVATGLPEVAWIVPEGCEWVRFPSWDGMHPVRARYWNRPAWLMVPAEEALRLRTELFSGLFEAFRPDAVFVDYPFGYRDELLEPLRRSAARKYLVLRGIIDTADHSLLCGEASASVGREFDRILVTADPRVVDVVAEYAFAPDAARKVTYTGYVAPAPPRDRIRTRRGEGLPDDQFWVVCSGGGGIGAEEFLTACTEVAALRSDARFDVVFGPRSRPDRVRKTFVPANCHVSRVRHDLASLHAAADVVVTTGGYNSVMEGAAGGARIILRPSLVRGNDEQGTHAARLAAHYPIHIVPESESLPDAIAAVLHECALRPRPVLDLATSGAERIRELLCADLGITGTPVQEATLAEWSDWPPVSGESVSRPAHAWTAQPP